MSDVVHIGQWGAMGGLYLGLNTASDNHGNSVSGFNLKCSGRPVGLNVFDLDKLMSNIETAKGFAIMRFDGEFPVAHDRPSPLQQMCNDIRAHGHNTLGDWAKRMVGL